MKIQQSVEFDAAHRLYGYPGNCSNVHGHTWSVDIEIESDRNLDSVGMLLDYRIIKQHIKDNYDHRIILNIDDPLVEIFSSQKLAMTVMNGNPTAENLANRLLAEFILIADLDVTCSGSDFVTIKVHESSENYAEASR